MDTFVEHAKTKLQDLREEWSAGEKMLAQLETKQQGNRDVESATGTWATTR